MATRGATVLSVIACVAAVSALALLGSWLTDIGPWYRNLRKPWFQPPDVLFGPAWSAIFACLAGAAALAWNAPHGTSRQRTVLVVALVLNFALNALWSFLFFTQRRPDLALVEVIVFWCSIVLLIVVVRPLSTTAAWLLTPYLVWVSFATVLNQRIVALNAPFPRS